MLLVTVELKRKQEHNKQYLVYNMLKYEVAPKQTRHL